MNGKTGRVTVKKGLKKGTYSVKVIIKAKGNANYEISDYHAVQFKVRVLNTLLNTLVDGAASLFILPAP